MRSFLLFYLRRFIFLKMSFFVFLANIVIVIYIVIFHCNSFNMPAWHVNYIMIKHIVIFFHFFPFCFLGNGVSGRNLRWGKGELLWLYRHGARYKLGYLSIVKVNKIEKRRECERRLIIYSAMNSKYRDLYTNPRTQHIKGHLILNEHFHTFRLPAGTQNILDNSR